jgi:hypothetical protein
MLFACSSGDTIVSLNVNSSSDVELVTRLHVKFVQGNASHEVDLVPPTREVQVEGAADGVNKTVIASSFYRRITLPAAFKDGEATLDVEAYNDAQLILDPAPISIELEEKETVAAFVELKPATSAGGGTGGTGGTTAVGAGGTDSASGTVDGTSAGGEVGNAGTGN